MLGLGQDQENPFQEALKDHRSSLHQQGEAFDHFVQTISPLGRIFRKSHSDCGYMEIGLQIITETDF
jgi:hypothetical protein